MHEWRPSPSVKRPSIIAAIVLIALVLVLIVLAPSPTDTAVEDQLKDKDARAILAAAVGALLVFLLGYGVRDALGRQTSRTGRDPPGRPEEP